MWWKLGLFLALSIMDIVLTRILFFFGAVEANPIANAVITSGGYSSVITFKAAIVVAVTLIAVIVVCTKRGRRKGYGHLISNVGVCVTGVVVMYSMVLLVLLCAANPEVFAGK